MVAVIGTAHISKQSVEEVRQTILELQPEVVAVELCEARYRALLEQRDVPILDLVRSKNSLMVIANVLLSFLQQRLGAEVGIKPGSEMLAAISAAGEVGARVALVDRDIRITLKRTLAKMGFLEKIRVFKEMVSTYTLTGEDIEGEIDNLKKEANVAEVLEKFKDTSPNMYNVLVDERNAYMAKRILDLGTENVVAVVGAGHKRGIEEFLREPEKIPDLRELMEMPSGFSVWRILKYGVPALVLGMFVLALSKGVPIKGPALLWVLNHSIPTFLGVMLAGGSLFSAAVGMLASPLTALNPLLAAGWFAGLAETKVRRVTVGDVSQMFKVGGMRELYRNNAFKVLLVTALANLGSMLGTFVSFPTIILPLYRSLIG
ncbi:MAG: TraB/GumN family protein [Candidatus Hydrothermarchaeaceae archaeon]